MIFWGLSSNSLILSSTLLSLINKSTCWLSYFSDCFSCRISVYFVLTSFTLFFLAATLFLPRNFYSSFTQFEAFKPTYVQVFFHLFSCIPLLGTQKSLVWVTVASWKCVSLFLNLLHFYGYVHRYWVGVRQPSLLLQVGEPYLERSWALTNPSPFIQFLFGVHEWQKAMVWTSQPWAQFMPLSPVFGHDSLSTISPGWWEASCPGGVLAGPVHGAALWGPVHLAQIRTSLWLDPISALACPQLWPVAGPFLGDASFSGSWWFPFLGVKLKLDSENVYFIQDFYLCVIKFSYHLNSLYWSH